MRSYLVYQTLDILFSVPIWLGDQRCISKDNTKLDFSKTKQMNSRGGQFIVKMNTMCEQSLLSYITCHE